MKLNRNPPLRENTVGEIMEKLTKQCPPVHNEDKTESKVQI